MSALGDPGLLGRADIAMAVYTSERGRGGVFIYDFIRRLRFFLSNLPCTSCVDFDSGV